MSKEDAPNFRDILCCEHCTHISWITRKDAWCTKHEFDLNPAHEVFVARICDDFEVDDE